MSQKEKRPWININQSIQDGYKYFCTHCLLRYKHSPPFACTDCRKSQFDTLTNLKHHCEEMCEDIDASVEEMEATEAELNDIETDLE